MDDEARQALAKMDMPRRPINFVPAKSGEILKLGHITYRIMEDGSRTGKTSSSLGPDSFPSSQIKTTASEAQNSQFQQGQLDLRRIGTKCTTRLSS